MTGEQPRGFLIAAPHSGSGKTTITLGLMRAFRNAGIAVGPAKAGPDFIDPAFHTVASGTDCVNLDAWAMSPDLVTQLASQQAEQGTLIVEAMMGLFDGAADGSGSAADLAVMLGLPVVLVIDCASQSHSIAALVAGFRDHRSDVQMAGVILNKVGSKRHEDMMREALDAIHMPVLGVMMRDEKLALPSRHLGLVQASEQTDLEFFIEHAAEKVKAGIDLTALGALQMAQVATASGKPQSLRPLGQNIAVARDRAFSFSYPHLLDGWQRHGANLSFFSPLENETPDASADAIYLPGGYPELHGGVLAAAQNFLSGLKSAAQRGALVYGECGGYMVLGDGLVDAQGNRHKMAGLLPLATSFKERKLHLGYRIATPLSNLPFSCRELTAHEFHYSTIVEEGDAERLFVVRDARGDNIGDVGLRRANVMGSYMHLIDGRG